MMLEFTVGINIAGRVRAQIVKETTINIIDALRGQQAQGRRCDGIGVPRFWL